MPGKTARSSGARSGAPRSRRMTATARRSSILKAARRAFSETGDVNGTTMRTIAERAGISEGAIYRHFESKDQLFYEAVVEPLREVVNSLVAATEAIDPDETFSPEAPVESLDGLYRQLVPELEQVLPLLGLVLFGDPKVAQRFYKEHFAAAMDRLGDVWGASGVRSGRPVRSPDIVARAVMGTALMLALELRHRKRDFDVDRAVSAVAAGTRLGFFPSTEAGRQGR